MILFILKILQVTFPFCARIFITVIRILTLQDLTSLKKIFPGTGLFLHSTVDYVIIPYYLNQKGQQHMNYLLVGDISFILGECLIPTVLGLITYFAAKNRKPHPWIALIIGTVYCVLGTLGSIKFNDFGLIDIPPLIVLVVFFILTKLELR